MDIKDLSIGNITYKLYDSGDIQSDVSCYDFERARLNNNETDIHWRKPIPLTEEWLFRFGFELDGEQINGRYYKFLISEKDGFKDYISIYDKGSFLESIYFTHLTSNYDKRFVLPMQYNYVHQLQNLYFALTGKELEVKDKLTQEL